MNRRRPSPRWNWLDVALLGLALLAAVGIRCARIDAAPSFDELWHLRLSAAKGLPLAIYQPDQLYLSPPSPTSLADAPPLWRVWTGLDGVLHPPLYVFTLRLWRDAFGEGNLAAHVYSELWGLIAIAFTFAAARLAMSRGIAVLVAIAMTLSPTQAYFAQEIRAYAMLTGVAALAAWMMARAEVIGPTRRIAVGLAALTLPLLLTHYFAFGAAAAIAIYGCWRLRGQRMPFLLTLTGAAIVYGVAWLPFALQQIDDLGSGDISWTVQAPSLTRQLLLAASAPFRLVVDRDPIIEPAAIAGGLLFILPWLLSRRCRPLAPWALALTCAVGALLILDLARSTQVVMVTRYVAVAGQVAFLVFVGCGWAIRRWLGYAVAAGLAAMGAIHLHAGTGVEIDVQNFGPVVAELERHAQPGEAVAAYGGAQTAFYGDAVLMSCANSPRLPAQPFINLSKPISPQALGQLGPRLWLVSSWSEPAPEALVPGVRVLRRVMIDYNVYLYHLELGSPTTRITPEASP